MSNINKKPVQTIKIVNNLDCFAERFEDIDLHKSIIKKAEFEECTFVSCDFSEAKFLSCAFIDCTFENCNLSVIKLTDTKISNTHFSSCKVVGIDWTMCNWSSLLNPESVKFTDSILDDGNFYGLDLERLVMRGCRAKDVDFRSGSFIKADFSSSDFKGALFGSTHLEGANFSDAQNTIIDIRNNFLEGAIFSRFEALYLLETMGIVLVD
jgi:fluoroquinolone resistance protein